MRMPNLCTYSLLVISVAGALVSWRSFADTQCSPSLYVTGIGYVLGASGNVSLSVQGMSDDVVQSAIGNWESGCPESYGTSFPSISIGTGGDVQIDVIYHATGSDPSGGCGHFDSEIGPVSVPNPGDQYSGQVVGGQIHIYGHTSQG